jgi:phosphatidylglycerophosphate synthase
MIRAESRAAETDIALARSAALNALAGLAILTGLGLALDGNLGLSGAFLPKALAVFSIALLVVARFLPLHRPHPRLGPANQITLLRVGLVSLLAALVGEGEAQAMAWAALALALTAEVLDGVDGHLARRRGWASPFGARFDMETDALLVAVLALLAYSLGKAGPWVLAAGLLRYLFVAAGYLWPWLSHPLPPSRRRQTACVVQVLTLTLALAPVLAPTWSAPLVAVGLGILCYSFATDTLWLARHGGPARRRLGPQ